ncbi:MAG: hypothetical protein BWX84_01715 [Verrucomicrobia bacterium ADurb.Bin118]|nr:MAG: hypothetical protein BWX84_01715 [Verrucomicrobia bacterium ADurb.Bin118]
MRALAEKVGSEEGETVASSHFFLKERRGLMKPPSGGAGQVFVRLSLCGGSNGGKTNTSSNSGSMNFTAICSPVR